MCCCISKVSYVVYAFKLMIVTTLLLVQVTVNLIYCALMYVIFCSQLILYKCYFIYLLLFCLHVYVGFC